MRGILTTLFAVACSTAALAATASADPPPPPTPPSPILVEDLRSDSGDGNPATITKNCNPDRTGTIGFTFSGPADGTYIGTVTETGSFTITRASTTNTTSDAAVVGNISFTIVSGDTTITGTKHFDDPLALAYCDDTAGRYFLGAGALGYDATIQTPTGSYHDEGVTGIDFRFVPGDYHFIDEKMISSLTETVPLVVAPGNSPLVHNGHGCGDPNHVHTGSGECH